MSENATPKAEPGWYPAAGAPGFVRYWDGAVWVGEPKPVTAMPMPHNDGSGLIGVGWVMSVFMPLIGGIIGIILLTKNRTDHGIGMIVVSIIAATIYYTLLVNAQSGSVGY